MEESKRSKLLPTLLKFFFATSCFRLGFAPATIETKLSRFISDEVVLDEESCRLETYILHVEKPVNLVSPQTGYLRRHYQSFLSFTTNTSSIIKEKRIVHAYKTVVSGFAAKLTEKEAKALQQNEGVLSIRKQKILSLHTTHTPTFLGLEQNLGVWKQTNYGVGVIIGVLDTGVIPGHPSFSDEGMPFTPAKWKGKCEFNFTACNKKLIGSRSFITTDGKPNSPKFVGAIDDSGHGTHTAGIAAGNFVQGANLFGNANGTAAGIAPLAHLAIYKVCDRSGCPESAILAAMDAAVEDGVDVLSLSLGGSSSPYYDDFIAIGAYNAIKNGVFVSCSAGNEGPARHSLSNEAPWILTVGASTIDRNIRTTVKLGNSVEFDGQSAFQPKEYVEKQLPLVLSTSSCAAGSFHNMSIAGKIVLCVVGDISPVSQGKAVKDAGGAGMILINNQTRGFTTFTDAHVLPVSHVSYAVGISIQAYVKSTPTPTAAILFKATIIDDNAAPAVAFFSSRGPSLSSPGILKPDVIGPGVNILAAWPTSIENHLSSKSTFNIISGTSNSCPHLSGVAALLLSSHPTWTPAAIKSAILTTTYQYNALGNRILEEQRNPADIFAIGAGHVLVSRAIDPGLIYDIQPDEYIPYLCGLNYTDKQIKMIVQQNVNCTETNSIHEAQLNYPTFSILLGDQNQTYTRTVTNVGLANSTYKVLVNAPTGVDVSLNPTEIVFTGLNQQMSYSVTFTKQKGVNKKNTYAEGYLEWVYSHYYQHYYVSSPISVIFQ